MSRLLAAYAPTLALPVGILLVWELLGRAGALNLSYFPPPLVVGKEFARLVSTGVLWEHLQATILRLGAAFLLAAVPGVLLGLLMGMSRLVRSALEPYMVMLFPMPKIALLPLVMIIMGIGEKAFIVTAALTAFFQIVVSTLAGVLCLDKVLIEAAENFGARGPRLFFKVILPGSLPYIFTGLRLGLGLALILVVVIEFVTAKSGLGNLVWASWQTLQVQTMYSAFLVVGLIGLGVTRGLERLGERLMPWSK